MSELRLVPLSLAVFEALASEDPEAADLLGLPIPAEFAEAVDIWRFMIRVVTEHPDNADWAMQAVVIGDDTIVGNAGFKGAPRDGQAELGYRIVPGHRRHGHALGAVRALLEHARREPLVARVIARISPGNDASVRVVTAAGFVPDGEWMSPRWGRQLQFVADVANPEWQTRPMPVTWDDVVAYAVTLPEVEESTTYRTPSLKVAGRLMGRLRTESEGGLALRCSAVDKESLVGGDDPAFYTTPHYDGHDYVLVDLGRVDRLELFELVTDAWHLAAPAAVRRRHAR